jgi:hypothetical protein
MAQPSRPSLTSLWNRPSRAYPASPTRAAQRSQQRQSTASTSLTDARRPPRDTETESYLKLKKPLGKTPLSLILDGNDIESQRKNAYK